MNQLQKTSSHKDEIDLNRNSWILRILKFSKRLYYFFQTCYPRDPGTPQARRLLSRHPPWTLLTLWVGGKERMKQRFGSGSVILINGSGSDLKIKTDPGSESGSGGM